MSKGLAGWVGRQISPHGEGLRLSKEAWKASSKADSADTPSAHRGASSYHREAANQWKDVARNSSGNEKAELQKRAEVHERKAGAHEYAANQAAMKPTPKMEAAKAAKSGGDEYNRDDQGRFASK